MRQPTRCPSLLQSTQKLHPCCVDPEEAPCLVASFQKMHPTLLRRCTVLVASFQKMHPTLLRHFRRCTLSLFHFRRCPSFLVLCQKMPILPCCRGPRWSSYRGAVAVGRHPGLHAQAERRPEEAHGAGAAHRHHPPHLRVLDGGRPGRQPQRHSAGAAHHCSSPTHLTSCHPTLQCLWRPTRSDPRAMSLTSSCTLKARAPHVYSTSMQPAVNALTQVDVRSLLAVVCASEPHNYSFTGSD